MMSAMSTEGAEPRGARGRGQPPSRPSESWPKARPARGEPERVVVPQMGAGSSCMLPLALLAMWALASAAGKVLVIFIVAAVIALYPQPGGVLRAAPPAAARAGWPCWLVYLAFFLTLAGVGSLLANPISEQVTTFTRNLPHIVDEANAQIAKFQRTLDKGGIHVKRSNRAKTALQTFCGKTLEKRDSDSELQRRAVDGNRWGAGGPGVGVRAVGVHAPLRPGDRCGSLRRAMPPGDGSPVDDYPRWLSTPCRAMSADSSCSA